MMALLVYSIKSAIVLILLYLPYTLMLRRESFFRMNRITLLTILILALILPLCHIPALIAEQQPAVYEVQHRVMMMEQAAEAAAIIQSPDTGSPSISWLKTLSIIYLIGISIAVLIRIWQLVRIHQQIRSGCLWKDKNDRATVYCHIDNIAPFSWMRSIVISESDYQPYGREILLHERAHILCRHSLDILLLTFVEALQWWNPIIYMLGSSLRDVHEYEADDYVLQEGISLQNYQALLVRKAMADTTYAFANNFNHSLIKKRIYMMNHPKSNPRLRSKVLYLLPLTLVVLCAFATPELNKNVETVVKKVETFTAPIIKEDAVKETPVEEPQIEDIITEEVSKVDEQSDTLDAAIVFEDYDIVDSILMLNRATVNVPPQRQEYVATNRFKLDGIVSPELWDVEYLINFYENDNKTLSSEPTMLIPVKDNHFSLELNMDKPRIAHVRAILKDSTLCSAWMEMWFRPGHKLNITVMNGHFDTVEYPIYDLKSVD